MGFSTRILSASAAVVLSVAPAMAGDFSASGAATDLWSGMHWGVVAGGGVTSSKAVDVANYNLLGNEVIDYQASGFVGGLTLGHNRQDGSWVWGLEGDISWANIDGTGASAYDSGGGPGTDTFLSSSIDWLSTVRGRAGYLLGDGRVLAFATGGLAVGGVTHSVLDVDGPDCCDDNANLSKSSTGVGYALGVGAELMLDGGWSVKGEYLCVDLGGENVTGLSNVYSDTINYAFSDHLNVFRIGLNRRF